MLARMSGKAEQAHEAKNALHLGDAIRGEVALLIGLGTATIFLAGGSQFVELVAHPVVMIVVFIWLFAVILWSAVSAARHADCLAIKWGEPYGTLILTLSAITIEVVVVSTAMLHGENNPTLGRDSVFSVIMIALNGFVGLCLLMGGLRYREQHYNLQGVNSYINVITIGFVTKRSVALGVQGGNLPLLLLTLAVSVVTFTSRRTNVLQGSVHLLLFAVFVLLLFAP
jgi:Ca2+:H+ antiporter